MKKTILFIALSGAILLCFSQCRKKKTEEEELKDNFDKPAMLSNYADNVIIPNLTIAKNAMDSLALAYSGFQSNKNTTTLAAVRQKFIRSYIAFQYISTFEFGPSETELVRSNFNTYPCDTGQILSNISAGTYDFSTIANLDAKGFPAIDYLLFDKNKSDAAIVALFDTDAKAANRTTYITNCITEMQTKLNSILNSWTTSYKNTFVSSTGSEIGSSLGMLVNQLDYEIDLLKNGKIGIPLGKKSLDVALPEKCEAYYANTISVSLAMHCLLNIENEYLGRSLSGADGLGIDDYLDALEAQHVSGSLNNAIKAQFAAAKAKLALVQDPLSAAVINNPATVDAAYIELVKLLVLLKTDAPSALGIVITYQDGDGD